MSREIVVTSLKQVIVWSTVLAFCAAVEPSGRGESRAQELKVESRAPELKTDRLQDPIGRPASEVRDTAGLFGAGAITAAERRLRTIEKETRVVIRVETIDSLKGEPINDVAERAARRSGIEGVYVLIARRERGIDVLPSRQLSTALPRARIATIREAFIEGFRRQDFNDGLRRGVEAIQEAIGAAVRAGDLSKVASSSAPAEPERVASPRSDESAESPRLILRNQARLTLAGARAMIAAAEVKARSMDLKVNIAVVDDGGHLLAFERMDGARPASGYTAMTKATTAATFRLPTGPQPSGAAEPDILLSLSLQNAAQASGGKITTLQGGIPVEAEGQVIGGIGVGGGTGDQDAEIARAGAQVLHDSVGKAPLDLMPPRSDATPSAEKPR